MLMGQGSTAGLGAARRGSVPGAVPAVKEGGHGLSPAPQKSRPISHMACVSQEGTQALGEHGESSGSREWEHLQSDIVPVCRGED